MNGFSLFLSVAITQQAVYRLVLNKKLSTL